MVWVALLLVFAAPFWETKAPADWTDNEVAVLLTDSPWAQTTGAAGSKAARPVQIYFATAAPMQQAERERDRRFKRKRPGPPQGVEMAEEYQVWLEENRATQIVIAVAVGNNPAFSNAEETHRMEEESVMRAGRKKFKTTGYFPPSAGDPYLRLAFPRQVSAADKTIAFDLYLPGVELPFRSAEFPTKDMTLNGKPEM
jgi:hypothetical protein